MDLIPNTMSIWSSDPCQLDSTENSVSSSSLRSWIKVRSFFAKTIPLLLIGAYRSLGSAWLGGACRFEPSCSEYAAQAFQKHPFFYAFSLTFRRILKCRPGGGCGYDPLPNCRGHQHG